MILPYWAVLLGLHSYESGQLTLNTQTPLWVVYSSVPVAALMLGGRYVVKCVDLIRGGPAMAGAHPPPSTHVASR